MIVFLVTAAVVIVVAIAAGVIAWAVVMLALIKLVPRPPSSGAGQEGVSGS